MRRGASSIMGRRIFGWMSGRVLCRLILFGAFMVKLSESIGFDGIPGQFCSTRQQGCCPDRNDRCSVPVHGTECYCDEFCDRREGESIPDCCPDFYEHCRNQPRIQTTTPTTTTVRQRLVLGCWLDSEFHSVGTKIRKNCNDCYCRPVNGYQDIFEFQCEGNICLIEDDLLRKVNSNPEYYKWTAGNYSFLYGMTLEDGYRYRLGTFKPEEMVTRMHEVQIDKNAILPDRFDARERWPRLIHDVRDQGNCAASWAFSTTALAADRIAIMTKGEKNFSLSVQHLISCNSNRQKGCNGGYIDRAWWYLRKKGVVAEECYPFSGEEAARTCRVQSLDLTGVVDCPSGSQERRLYETTPAYRIAQKENEIRYEIFTNGPVQAVFHVSPDFFMYQSGVYRASEDLKNDLRNRGSLPSGYHSVRIIGWGIDTSHGSPVNYWLCANSWGTSWGEDGTFRILRGKNEAEIESFVIGVWGRRLGEIYETEEYYRRRRNLQRYRRRQGELKEKSQRALKSIKDLLR